MMFSLKIPAYRKELKLTQAGLAKLLYVCVRTIKYWESGRLVPRPATLKMIERYLDDVVLDYKLTKKICPIDRNTMRERYGGAGLAKKPLRLKEEASGTSGNGILPTSPSLEPSLTAPTDSYEDEIGFGK